MRQPRILMCPPDHYGIEYEINPWMKRERGSSPQRARAQWRRLHDTLAAQRRMRELIHGIGFALMIATALHAIATGNLLPAWVRVACVDINPATVTKLTDRGSVQTVGVVTDAEPFLRALVHELVGPEGK